MLLSLVIPCYNEEGNVELFFSETNKAFKGKVDNYEFVFVDDGSKDSTLQKLKQIYGNHPDCNIQVLSFSRNFGKESAIYAGLSKAKGDLACIIDADLQQRPEVVLEMLEEMDKDDSVDCVTAFQETRRENRIVATLKTSFYKIINSISEVNFVNAASDFRLMKRNMVDALLSMTEYHRFSKGLFMWVGFNTRYIPYVAEERATGESKWNVIKLFKYAFEGIFAFSTAPLLLSAYAGIFSLIASVVYFIVALIRYFAYGASFSALNTAIILLLLIGGIQLFCLGILGEYLSKVYVQVKNRPIYILREHLYAEKDPK